ncbi:MAG: glycosyltransferase family 2 protein [bacterium]
MKPKVSVIIVSYNTRRLTVKSIKSAYASKGFAKDELEVILVDNNSKDDTVSYIKEHLPEVKLITNRENKGFGGGNNQGVKIAKGKYVLLLNTDAFLAPDSLKVLVDILEKNNDIVSVGPQLRYGDGRLQPSGGYLPTPLRVMAWMFWWDKLPLIKKLFPTPYHVFDPAWHKKTQYPDWLMGACVMFRREEFLAAGGFDEKIFMYAEEVELYRRLKENLGKKVLFTPKTQVVHLGRASSNKANAFVLTHELKGIKYIYQKHYPHLLWFIKLAIFKGVLLRLAVFSLIPSRREVVKEYQNYFLNN